MDYASLKLPLTLQEYTWRPIEQEDAKALNTLLLAAEAQDKRGWVDTLEDRERDFTDPDSNPATDSLAVLTPQGQLVAFGWVFTPPPGETESISFLDGNVHPDYRRRGLGTAILKWLVQRAQEIQHSKPGPQARYIRANFPDHLTSNQKIFERQGFKPIRYYYRMRRDLSQPIPTYQLSDALHLQTWNPELDADARKADNEAFEDHWGHIPMDEDHWNTWFIQHEDFRPELSFMVTNGNEIAGLSINKVRTAENAATGIKEGWIQSLAVRRPWRRQGIATALLCASMNAFKEAGLDFAGLTVDTDNLTGALRIYERLGFMVVIRFISVSIPISMEF